MKKLLLIVALLLAACGPVSALPRSVIVITPSDSIQAAVNAAAPGDVIELMGGVYNQSVSISKAITLTAYPGETPILDGQNSRGTAISISGSGAVISGLTVMNYTDHDIDVDNASSVVLDGLTVLVTGRAVFIQDSDGVIVRNCLITTPSYQANQTDGIYSQRNVGNVYEYNTIIIFNAHTSGHDDAIQSYLDTDLTIRGNYAAQVNDKTSNAQGIYVTTAHGTTRIYNNVVNVGNAQSNALSFRRLPAIGGTGTVEIVGNTVVGIRPYHGIWVTETDGHIVKNNIVYLQSGAALTISSGGDVSNNYTGNPRFVDAANLDFHLQSNSPVIGGGAVLGSPYDVDKDGLTRGVSWDIGAYEYDGTPVTVTPPSPTSTQTPVTATATRTPTVSTATPTRTSTATASRTPTATPTAVTPSRTATVTPSRTATPTVTPSGWPTACVMFSPPYSGYLCGPVMP